MISDFFFFINYYTAFFFPNNLGLFLCCQAIIVPVILDFRESVRVFLCTYSACPLSFSPAVLARNRSFRIGSYISYIITTALFADRVKSSTLVEILPIRDTDLFKKNRETPIGRVSQDWRKNLFLHSNESILSIWVFTFHWENVIFTLLNWRSREFVRSFVLSYYK